MVEEIILSQEGGEDHYSDYLARLRTGGTSGGYDYPDAEWHDSPRPSFLKKRNKCIYARITTIL